MVPADTEDRYAALQSCAVLRLDQPVTRTDISSWLERYKAAGVHSYGVQVSPALQPASATQLLVQEGLRRHDSWTR